MIINIPHDGSARNTTFTSHAVWMLIVLTAINVCNVVDRTLISILLPSIKKDLVLTDLQIGLIAGPAFAVFYAFMALPMGWLAERTVRKRLIGGALLLWSAMTGLSGLARNFGQLMMVRVAVAIGEAGGSPPSYSMISDAFPVRNRALAMAVFTSAGGLGGFLGLTFGGWSNQYWGWRASFGVAAVVGLLLTPLVIFSVREPTRGLSDESSDRFAAVSAREALQKLCANRTFPQLTAAAALSAFASYSLAIWQPSFISRSYHLTSGQVGTVLGLVSLVGGLMGSLTGGEFARRAGLNDLRWWLWTPAIGFMVAAPMLLVGLFVHNLYVTLGCFLVGAFLMFSFTGPLFAAVNTIVPAGMRGMSSSTLLFCQIILGLGLGPLITGWVSDLATRSLGAEGLRYALIVPVLALLWGAIHYLLASRTLREDARLALLANAFPTDVSTR